MERRKNTEMNKKWKNEYNMWTRRFNIRVWNKFYSRWKLLIFILFFL